jgi:hypothetical protein
MNLVDYDNTCQSVGERVQDGDHLVRAALTWYEKCKSWKGVATKALYCRDKAVKEQKFLLALIHDTIHNDAQREIENA